MQADTSPDSSNLAKVRREFEGLYQGVDQQAVWDRIMEFYATTFNSLHDVVGRSKPHVEYWHHVATLMDVDPAQAVVVGNNCIEDASARLAGIETYLVTDYVIGDAASSGADHISGVLGFERWVLANY